MGSGTFDPNAYRTFSASTKGKSTDEIYSSRSIHSDLNPLGVKFRESRDGADNPNSTPLIVGIDVTGSMGMIADVLAREGLWHAVHRYPRTQTYYRSARHVYGHW
jgi:hypothetical protein